MATTDIRGASLSLADPPISTNPNPDLAWKAPVRVATTGANINLQTIGLGTIDSVALAAGDRVLVKDQTDATTNGIYNAQSSTWTRTIDGNNNSQWTTGTQVAVAAGTINAGNNYKLTAAIPIILGTSLMTWGVVSSTAIIGANPTAKVGLTAVNGSSLTVMRSDAAPPIDQAIVPTWTALHTFTGGLASTPSGLTQGLTVTQAPSGTASNPAFNLINISPDVVNAGSGFANGFAIIHGFGTSAAFGGRQALTVTLSLNAATAAGNTNRNYAAGVFISQAQTSDGGGVGSERGLIFGFNTVALLSASAQNFLQVKSYEADIQLEAGSSTLDKYGINIVQNALDAVSGSRNDAALFFGNAGGAVGWGTLIQIGDNLNANPLKAAGSILAIKGAPTFANGIDLSGAASITGSAFKSPSYSVDGSGIVKPSGINIGSANATFGVGIKLADSSSGQVLIAGTVRGIRMFTSAGGGASSFIEGVDQTGTGSFQPLTVAASVLTLASNGEITAVTIDTSQNVTLAGDLGIGTAVLTSSFCAIAAATTAKSQIRLATGGPPTSPVDGDIWREDNTNTGLKIRINGLTKSITVA